MSQTSFSLYLHNQRTDFHKLSCAGKPQMRAICTYVGSTKAVTNDWDIRLSVAVKALSTNISWIAKRICIIKLTLKSAHQSIYNLSGTSFDHVMATACAQTITLLYIYLCIWRLDLRLNNVNYSCWYFSLSVIITSLYWTSGTPLSSSITTSEYLICDKGSLPFITISDANQMVSMVKIYLWINLNFAKRVQQIKDEQDWITILFEDVVKTTEVDIKAQWTIFLLNK